jgi:hypothetical protein
MRTVLDMLPPGKENDPEAIEARIVDAYLALFSGNGDQADADIVLVDLAQESGYFITLPANASDGECRDHNGARRVFGRLLMVMNLPADRINQLTTALLSSPVSYTEQG